MQLKAIKDFSWAHRHVEIREYAEGDLIDTEDQDLIEVSIREGWAVDAAEAGTSELKAPAKATKAVKAPAKAADQPAEQAAAQAAPEAAAEAGAPEVKAD